MTVSFQFLRETVTPSWTLTLYTKADPNLTYAISYDTWVDDKHGLLDTCTPLKLYVYCLLYTSPSPRD